MTEYNIDYPLLVLLSAMTATSVGISVGVWREEQVLHKETGHCLGDKLHCCAPGRQAAAGQMAALS